MPIIVPSAEDAAAIVRYLDHVDRRIRRYIRTKQTLIKLLNEQKQIIIQQAVTSGLHPDAPRKDSGVEWLGEVPAHWDFVYYIRLQRMGRIL
jgi:type I restriction enzyme S subunit